MQCNPESCPNNGLWLRTNPANAQAKTSLLSQVLRRLTPDANPKASDTSARETTRAAPLSKPPQQTQSNAAQLPDPSASGDVHSEKVSLVPGTTKFRPRTIHSGQTQPNVTNDGDTSTATLERAHATSTQQSDFLPTAHTSELHSAFVDPSSPPLPNLPNEFMAYNVNDVENPHDLNQNSLWFLEDTNVMGDWYASSFTPEGLPSFTGLANQGNPLSPENLESVLNAPLGRQQNAPLPDLIQSPISVNIPTFCEDEPVRLPQRPDRPRPTFFTPPDDLPCRSSAMPEQIQFSEFPKSLRSSERTRSSEFHMEPQTPNEGYTQFSPHSNDRRFTGESALSTRIPFISPIKKCALLDTGSPIARNGHTEMKSKDSVSTRLKNMISSPQKRLTPRKHLTDKRSARHAVDANTKGAISPLLAGTYQDSTSANPGLHASQVQSWVEAVNVSNHPKTPEQYFPAYELAMARELGAFDLGDTKRDEI